MTGNEELKKLLTKIHKDLEPLKSKNYKEGQDTLSAIKKQIKMIIRRVYPDHKEVEKSLFNSLWMYTDDESLRQKDYLDNIDECVVAIDTIMQEEEVFGLEDFKPTKEKTETTTKISLPKVFSHEIKKSK